MKNKRIITTIAAIALVAVIGVGATFAYLTSTSDTKTNTFTVGKVDISIDETAYVEEGKEDFGDVTPKEDGYEFNNLLPGFSGTKEPTITVSANSTDSYVFATITGIDALEAKGIKFDAINADWTKVDGSAANLKDGVYVYKDVVATSAADVELSALFSKVSIDSAINGEISEISGISPASVTVQGSAIQAAGFKTATDAFEAYKNQITA